MKEKADFVHEAGPEKDAVENAAAVDADGRYPVAGVQFLERAAEIDLSVSGLDAVDSPAFQPIDIIARRCLGDHDDRVPPIGLPAQVTPVRDAAAAVGNDEERPGVSRGVLRRGVSLPRFG